MNFLLSYESKAGSILDPMIAEIIQEIKQWETEAPPSDNGRYPRKNKRSLNPDRCFKQAVRIIILNLLQLSEIRDHDVHLGISRDANRYNLKDRYSPLDMTYDPFIEAYQGLKTLGYLIVVHEGFFDPLDGGGWCTRIAASDLLLSLYDDAKDEKNIQFISRKITKKDKDELIILKGPIADRPGMIGKIPYEDNKFTNTARKNLNKINQYLSTHNIRLQCSDKTHRELLLALQGKQLDDAEQTNYIDPSAIRLYRIFSESSFQRGGRFYRGWWQQVPKNYRKHIVINDQPTVELDYSRFHISIAYAQLGLTLPSDPYKIHPKVSTEITKYAINAMLNAKGIVDPHKDFNGERCAITWENFIKLIEQAHTPIVENGMWMTGYGLTLQFLDAQVAEEILLHCVKEGIPCLPIHDSFIIPVQYEEELRDTMQRVYRKHFNQSIEIKEREDISSI